MATPINTIKNWFKTGMFPTQAQFWAWLDSYRHKGDNVPVAEIDGLTELLAPVNAHFDNPNAHSELFLKTKIYAFGELQIFKKDGNESNSLESGDLAIGFISTTKFIKAIYNTGDITEVSSFTVLEETDF